MSEKMLQQILHEIKDVKRDQQEMKEEFSGFKQDLSKIKHGQQEIKEEFIGFKQEQGAMKEEFTRFKHVQLDMRTEMDRRFDALETDVEDIKQSVARIERNVLEDILAILRIINSKLDQRDPDDVEQKKPHKVESSLDPQLAIIIPKQRTPSISH